MRRIHRSGVESARVFNDQLTCPVASIRGRREDGQAKHGTKSHEAQSGHGNPCRALLPRSQRKLVDAAQS